MTGVVIFIVTSMSWFLMVLGWPCHCICETGPNDCRTCDPANNCLCNSGFGGSHCTEIDECSPDPCLNGGICIDFFNSYSCTCQRGYTGTTCDVAYEIDECLSNPCFNGATCIDGHNIYNCTCQKGFTGTNCEIVHDTDECSSNPCEHGARCINLVGGYECICKNEYSGSRCETVPSVLIKPTIILDSVKVVPEGTSSVVVPCYAEGMPVPKVTWNSVNGALPVNVRQMSHYLIFENVSMSDDGFYMCRASNEVGQDIQVLHLSVKAKPTRQHSSPTITAPSTVQANYYSSVNLTCKVTGYPEPTIMWHHDNQKISGTRTTLTIHKADNTTQGVYTCSATNDAGTSSANIVLKVVHGIPKITDPPKHSVINAGSNHSFICQASGVPVPSMTWTFQSFGNTATAFPTHSESQHGTNITLVNMQKSGVLSCTATNEFGTDKAQANVIVLKGSGTALG